MSLPDSTPPLIPPSGNFSSLYVDLAKILDAIGSTATPERLENDIIGLTYSELLKNEAMCVLDELTDEDIDIKVLVEEPEHKEQRRQNLNLLVSLCEKIVGV